MRGRPPLSTWSLLNGNPTDDTHRLKSEVDGKVNRLRGVILNASLALTMENLHYHVLYDFFEDPVEVRGVEKDLDVGQGTLKMTSYWPVWRTSFVFKILPPDRLPFCPAAEIMLKVDDDSFGGKRAMRGEERAKEGGEGEEGEEGEGGKDPSLPGSKRRHRPFLDPLGPILGTC
jgi:hypothetical protein